MNIENKSSLNNSSDFYYRKYLKYKTKYKYLKFTNLLGGGESLDELNESIKQISNQIHEIYRDETDKIFIFLGSSPAYLYYYFMKCFTDFNSVLIPISGLSLIFQPNYFHTVDIQQTKKFCEYINKIIYKFITPDIIEEAKKIVLIDHSHTGKSITNFVELIRRCDVFMDKEIEFCNLVDVVTPIDMINLPKNVSNIHIIRGTHINDMSGHNFPRLTKQIHFTDIINKSSEDLDELLEDKTELEEGEYYQALKVKEC